MERALTEGQPAAALSMLDGAPRADESALAQNLRGRALVALGRRDEAHRAFAAAAELDPSFDRAWANLAKLDAERGRFAEALALLERGLVHNPNSARLRRAAANATLRTGRPGLAVVHLERLAELEPSSDSWQRLGHARASSGDVSSAVDAFLRAAAFSPVSPKLLVDLHSAAASVGRVAELEPHLARAAGEWVDPRELCVVAAIAYSCSAFDVSEAAARRALSIDPACQQAILTLASAQSARGRDDEAESTLRGALNSTTSPGALLELVRRRRLANDPNEAWKLLELAVDKFPDNPRVLVAYAEDARRRLLHAEGLRMLLRAVALDPNYADARSELAHELMAFRRVTEALEHSRTAVRLRPDEATYHATLLFDSHYVEDEPQRIADAHRHFGRKFGFARPVLRREGRLDPERPLRIGYVSSDFRDHSVAYFIKPILERQSRGTNAIYCYGTSEKKDDVTERIRELPLVFRDVVSLSNAALAEQIVEDRIDVLIDLGGMTNHQRLGVFARRPAAIQMTYLGYPDTTGLDCFDYRITDPVADPPGAADELHSERLLRMPYSAWCFHAGHEVPMVEPTDRPTVFACFNFLPKITDVLATAWARILSRVPGSKLVLKSALLADAEAQRMVVGDLERCGLEPGRVEYLGWMPTRLDHLRFHENVDIALDPFPYGGTTTTCDALWMGVPVVTLSGSVHSSRVGASLLRNVALDDLVATSIGGYEETAVKLAADLERRRVLRRELRDRMKRGHLGDPGSFVPAFDELVRGAWRKHVAGRLTGRIAPPGARSLELGNGVSAVVSADPTAPETFQLLEQLERALPGLDALASIGHTAATLLDLTRDAGEVAAWHSSAGGRAVAVRSNPTQLDRVRATLTASGLIDHVRCELGGLEWLSKLSTDDVGRFGVVRIDMSPKPDVQRWLGALLEFPLAVLWSVAEGEQHLAVGIAEAVGGACSVYRPGLGAFSPWTASEAGEARATLLLTKGPASDFLAKRNLLVAVPNAAPGGRESRVPIAEREAAQCVEALRQAEDAALPLIDRLASLEIASKCATATSLEEKFARARALVHLARRSEASLVVEECLGSLDSLDDDAEPATRPLPSQDAQILSGSVADRVEQLAIEAFVKLSAPSSFHQSKAVLRLLIRYQSLGGPDPEMARRFGLLFAREGLAD